MTIRILCFIFALLATVPAIATNVSADITTNTTWTIGNSPFYVTAPVRIRNNKTLSIDSNVKVYFSPNASLVFESGSKMITDAIPGQEILFDSLAAAPGSGLTPQRGDWGPIEFIGVGSDGKMEHVLIRHGKGLKIEAGFGMFRNIRFENNAVSAMQVGINASPYGDALVAVGNDINGILVPAGNQTANVRWRLKGIPYVVQAGLLRIGQDALTVTPTGATILPAATAQFRVVLADPAPAGGKTVTLQSSNLASATVPPTAMVAEAAYETTFTATAVATGQSRITATLADVGEAQTTLNVTAAPALFFSASPTSIPSGRVTSVELTRSTTTSTPLAVTLGAAPGAVATVPSQVSFAPQSSTVSVPVTGVAAGTVTLSASANGLAPASRALTVRNTTMSWPTPLLIPLAATFVPITFSDPVPPGGDTITLSASNANLQIPASITVPAGFSTVQVPITGLTEGTTTLTATSSLFGTATRIATVQQINLSFETVSATIPLGLTEGFRVRSDRVAPPGGITVTVTNSDPARLELLTASVSIPAGSSSSSEHVRLRGLTQGTVQLNAASPTTAAAVMDLAIGPAATLQFATPDIVLGRTLTRDTSVSLSINGAPYVPRLPVVVALASSNPATASAPVSVNLASSSATVSLTGVNVSAAPVAITASSAEVPVVATLSATVKEAELGFEDLATTRNLSDTIRDGFSIRWRVQGETALWRNAVQRTAAITVVNAAPQNIVAGVYDSSVGGALITTVELPIGTGGVAGQRYVGVPATIGTYQVRATVTGLPDSTSEVQTVINRELRFRSAAFVAGQGLRSTQYMYVERFKNGVLDSSATPLSLSLTSSDSTKVQVPAQISIAQNQSRATVPISALDITVGTSIVVAPVSESYTQAAPLTVSVIEPELEFIGLDNARTISGNRDDFRVGFVVPGSADPAQATTADRTVGLSIVDANPAAIVAGIYDQFNGGSLATTALIPAGQGSSGVRYVGAPISPGSYKLRATLVGQSNGPWTSATQLVQDNLLSFADSSASMGRGLYRDIEIRLANAIAVPIVMTPVCTPASTCSVPASVTFGSFQTSASIRVTGLELGTATLSVTSDQPTFGTPSIAIDIIEPEFIFNLDPYDFFPFKAFSGDFNGCLPDGLGVTFKIINSSPTGVVRFDDGSVETTRSLSCFSGGTDSIGFDPLGSATWAVEASVPAYGAWVSPPFSATLRLQATGTSVSVGTKKSDGATIRFRRGNSEFDPTNPVDVTMACDPAICSTTNPTTIVAGSSTFNYIPITGLVEGSAIATFSSIGYEPSTARIDVVSSELYTRVAAIEINVEQDIEYCLASEDEVAAVDTVFAITNSDELVATADPMVEMQEGERCVTIQVTGLTPGSFELTFDGPGFNTIITAPIEVVRGKILIPDAEVPIALGIGLARDIPFNRRHLGVPGGPPATIEADCGSPGSCSTSAPIQLADGEASSMVTIYSPAYQFPPSRPLTIWAPDYVSSSRIVTLENARVAATPSSIPVGSAAVEFCFLNGRVPSEMTVNITSTRPQFVGAPSSVTIPANTACFSMQLVGVQPGFSVIWIGNLASAQVSVSP